jgi:hypothetical protein
VEFLHETPTGSKKIVRTVLYGDQEFTRFELEIVHTQIYQRLYDLKQLGFSDRIFPDAVHSRFNHLFGVVEVATRMAHHLQRWLLNRAHRDGDFEFTGSSDEIERLKGSALAKHVESRIPVLRFWRTFQCADAPLRRSAWINSW